MPKGSPEDIEFLRQFTKFAQSIVWLIPATLIPAGLFIFFAEEQNVTQLISILAFALALYFGLHWLLKITEKRLK